MSSSAHGVTSLAAMRKLVRGRRDKAQGFSQKLMERDSIDGPQLREVDDVEGRDDFLGRIVRELVRDVALRRPNIRACRETRG